MQNYYVHWEIARGSDGKEGIRSLLKTIQQDVEQQTDEQVKIGEVHDLEPATSVAISYVIGVGSALTAQAIVNSLEDHERTIDIEIETDADLSQDEIETETDNVELSISESTGEE